MIINPELIFESFYSDKTNKILQKVKDRNIKHDYDLFYTISYLCQKIPQEPQLWMIRNLIFKKLFKKFLTIEKQTLKLVYQNLFYNKELRNLELYCLNDLYTLELMFIQELINNDCNIFSLWEAMNWLYDLYNPIIIDYSFLKHILVENRHCGFVWEYMMKHINSTQNYKEALKIATIAIKRNRNNSTAWNLKFNIVSKFWSVDEILDDLSQIIGTIDNRDFETVCNYVFGFQYLDGFSELIKNMKFINNEQYLFKFIKYVCDYKLEALYDKCKVYHKNTQIKCRYNKFIIDGMMEKLKYEKTKQ